MLIGGLDLGTSGCKFTIYRDCSPVAQAARSYPANHNGRQHSIDADLVWSRVSEAVSEACAALPGGDKVRAIAVSSFGEAATPVDKEGRVLAEARLFWDDSGYEQNKRLVAALGQKRIFDITGLLANGKYSINKIAWFRDNQPEVYDRAVKFLLFEDFIVFRMTGEYKTSCSMAGRTMGFNIDKLCWSEEIFRAAGLDVGKMAQVLPSGSVAGQVLPRVADDLGLDRGCLLIAGGHDQMCVALGAGVIHTGRAVNGSGTVEALSTVLGSKEDVAGKDLHGYPCCIHADSRQRFTYGASSTGSVLLEWYLRTFGIPLMEEYKGANNIHAILEEQCALAPTKLLFLPYFEGAGLPFDDYNAKGVFVGMRLNTTRQDIYRALMESIAYDMCLNLNAQERMGLTIDEIYATGGGSNSALWMQIKADVTGKPIYQLSTTQAGTQGCMMLAAVAMGVYSSIDEAVSKNVRYSRVFEPNPAYHHIYAQKLEQFSLLYHSTRVICREGET